MQTDNRFLDDLARAASGALGALAGVRAEIESQLRAQLDRWLKAQNFVSREEFEAVKAMAVRAREQNEAQAKRLGALEAKLATQKPRRSAGAKSD
ncbi:MAG TPA: accessory factor UbiK family protein [Alphaproteobacteria bacterium]|nr:accessory factor UbiK family protein [Alphaproteobacteria bacterium]